MNNKNILEKAIRVKPSLRQIAWQKIEYYGFIHLGLNTYTDKEWGDGTEDPALFNPSKLNAEQWAKTFADVGMGGIILTCKHHDGFCLWPTKTTDYSIIASPWKNGQGDIVKEIADACKKYNLKFGVYLSPWDRNHPQYGTNKYNDVFIEQLSEILSNYGDIFEVWFDGACGEGANGKKQVYDWNRYYRLIRELQPNAVIAVVGPDVRWCGNEAGIGRETEWSVLPLDAQNQENIAENSQQTLTNGMFVPSYENIGNDLGSRDKIVNAEQLIWYPSEVDVSIRPGWFYHKNEDDKVKSLNQLIHIYYTSIGMNSSLLLNVPPDKDGLIHQNDINRLKELHNYLDNTFKNNYLKKAILKIDKCKVSLKEQNTLTDNILETSIKLKSKTPTFHVDFGKEEDISHLVLQENIIEGQLVEKFILEVKNKKGVWQKVTEGTTIGYKRIINFEKIKTRHARIKIDQSRSAPNISEIGFH